MRGHHCLTGSSALTCTVPVKTLQRRVKEQTRPESNHGSFLAPIKIPHPAEHIPYFSLHSKTLNLIPSVVHITINTTKNMVIVKQLLVIKTWLQLVNQVKCFLLNSSPSLDSSEFNQLEFKFCPLRRDS